MRYYFFITSQEMRDGALKPTLRALPGQTFPDGTPVDTNINVHAPRDPGSSINGCRQEYPDGTVFCSSHLELDTTRKTPFYSVYDSSKADASGFEQNPDFHPVNADGNLTFISPQHKSDKMELAYQLFSFSGDQGTDEEQTTNTRKMKNNNNYLAPSDRNGKANPIMPGWTPSYPDQAETEAELVCAWMRRILSTMGIRTMAKRPKADATSLKLFEKLFSAGETAGTIASLVRFDHVTAEQKMDTANLSIITKGPLEWYLGVLVDEHERQADCTAEQRSDANPADVEETAFLVSESINRLIGMTGETYNDKTVLDNTRQALSEGWTVDDLIHPDQLNRATGLGSYVAAIAHGVIPLPQHNGGAGQSYIDTLMMNNKYKRPGDKDGFYIPELTWKVLVRNLNRKIHTLLKGPSGSGKTEIVKRLCEQTGTPFTIIQMGTITDPTEQLVGKMDLDPSTGGTRFDWADFALAIQRPGVILLDEINRIPRNGSNVLLNLLDGIRELVASGAKSTDNRTIRMNPDCVFFATANIGDEYTGTSEIDYALRTRFQEVELDYLNIKQETKILMTRTGIREDDAKNISIVADNIRTAFRTDSVISHSVSTRETLRCAEYVKDGFDVEDAMEICFLPAFEGGVSDTDPNCERGAVRAIIASRFNKK